MAKNNNTEIPINGLYDEDGKLSSETNVNTSTVEECEACDGCAEEAEMSLSQEELETMCRESICPQCNVHQEAETARLRALADAENVKKRLNREAEDMRKYAGESILADLLPILDNLDLALGHTDNLDAVCKNFVIGVDMTRKLFLDAVKNHGLVSVEATRGLEFNPEVHEAVGTAAETELENNQIAQVVQAGYLLKGRLLRPAKVMVNKL